MAQIVSPKRRDVITFDNAFQTSPCDWFWLSEYANSTRAPRIPSWLFFMFSNDNEDGESPIMIWIIIFHLSNWFSMGPSCVTLGEVRRILGQEFDNFSAINTSLGRLLADNTIKRISIRENKLAAINYESRRKTAKLIDHEENASLFNGWLCLHHKHWPFCWWVAVLFST